MARPASNKYQPSPFGRKLTLVREARNITMADLAKLSGVSPQYINSIEKGYGNRGKKPSWGIIQRLAKVLRVDPSFFANDDAELPAAVFEEFEVRVPDEITHFVQEAESLPYLIMAKGWKDKGLSPYAINKILEGMSLVMSVPLKEKKPRKRKEAVEAAPEVVEIDSNNEELNVVNKPDGLFEGDSEPTAENDFTAENVEINRED